MSKVKEIDEIIDFLSKYSTIEVSDESYYSKAGCQCCSSGIGNTVHNVIALDCDNNKEEIVLCIDCINFFFYNDIPLYWVNRGE